MGEWNEAEHPRDDEGKFTYKGGGTTLYGHVEKSSLKNNSTTNNMLLKNNKIQNSIKIINKKEMDTYTQNLVKEIENTDINVKGIGNVKVKTLVPDIENYIEDNRTKDEKRADILYPSMKKENQVVSFLRVTSKAIPYLIKRVDDEIWQKDQHYSKLEVIQNYMRSSLEFFKFWKKKAPKDGLVKKLKNMQKFFDTIENQSIKEEGDIRKGKDKAKEIIYEMLDDYMASGEIAQQAANVIGYKNAVGILELSSKDSDLKTSYTQKADIYDNAKLLPEPYKSIIAKKLEKEHLDPNSKGVIFHADSELAKTIVESSELKEIISNNLNNIKWFCENNNNDVYTFDTTKGIEFNDGDLYFAIHKAMLINMKINLDGSISGDLIDTTDFNRDEDIPLIKAGRRMQLEGKLVPRFIWVHFNIPFKTYAKNIDS